MLVVELGGIFVAES